MIKIGIIGGSGLDNPQILSEVREKKVSTKYGQPSSSLKIGRLGQVEVVLLARHGREHTIPPTQINNRANIAALKEEGCTHILATTAVGSLREEIKPGDLVVLDQFIDFTRHRQVSFYDEFVPGKPEHSPMAHPFSDGLRQVLSEQCRALNLSFHEKGTVITIEGPRFSTKAESMMFRQWGADVINMSIAPEVILANEAGLPYAAIAMSTDYDCWKEDEAAVTWEAVLEIFQRNADKVTRLLRAAVPAVKEEEAYLSLKEKIRTIPHWPKPGVMFRDITTLLKDPAGFEELINILIGKYKESRLDGIIGIESRGFIIGSALAYKLGLGFIPIRKAGKLPADKISQEYALEYGTDQVEIHKDALKAGGNYLLVDDLIATGGTALASCQLVEKLGAKVSECCFVVNLPDLGGKNRLERAGHKTFSLIEFAGE